MKYLDKNELKLCKGLKNALFFFLTCLAIPCLAYGGMLTRNDVKALSPGNWYQITNEKFCDVYCATCCQNCWNGHDPRWNPYAYSGAVYDSIGNRVIIWGGGHNAWGGNEVYAFDYNVFQWYRLTSPSAYPILQEYWKKCARGVGYQTDGLPRQRHTRDEIVFDPANNRMYYMTSNSLYCNCSGVNSKDAGYLDLSNDKWAPENTVADCPGKSYKGKALYDAATGTIWLIGAQAARDNVYQYNPSKNKWIERYHDLGETIDTYHDSQAILDPVNRKIIFVGGGQYITIDISNPKSWTKNVGRGVHTGIPPSAVKKGHYSGDATLVNWGRKSPNGARPGFGLKYDPNTGLAIGWSFRRTGNNPSDIYILNPKNNHFVKIPAAPGSITPHSEDTGTVHGRFQVISDLATPILSAMYIDRRTYYHYVYKLSNKKIDRDLPDAGHFSIPATSKSTDITVTWSGASDPTSIVCGYQITTTPAKPKNPFSSSWSATPPSTYTVPSSGKWILYAWVHDLYGNISAFKKASVYVEKQ